MTSLSYRILSKMEEINYKIEFGEKDFEVNFYPKKQYTLKDFFSYIPLCLLDIIVNTTLFVVKAFRKLFRRVVAKNE